MSALDVLGLLLGGAVLFGTGVLTGRLQLRGRLEQLALRNRDLRRRNRAARRRNRALRESRQSLEDSYEELRRAEAEVVNNARLVSLGSLIAGVSHEMNTPLGALHAAHDTFRRALKRLQEILADERVDPEELEEVRRIVRAVDGIARTQDLAFERLTRIVAELRNFGRPDRAEVSVVDLHEGLESTLSLLAHELRGRVTVERDYGDLPQVECHPHRLNQVFMNLLANAAHAIEGEGTIVVRTSGDDEEVRVSVQDSGVGIPEEDLARIFEAGFTTKKARKGMGLGLLISRQIIHQHGGRIDVASRRGEGSTFTVTIPVRLPAGEEERRESNPPEDRQTGGRSLEGGTP